MATLLRTDRSVCFQPNCLNQLIVCLIEVNPNNSIEAKECGINKFNNDSPLTERIVGGNTSHPGEWPWQVCAPVTHCANFVTVPYITGFN